MVIRSFLDHKWKKKSTHSIEISLINSFTFEILGKELVTVIRRNLFIINNGNDWIYFQKQKFDIK